MAQLMTPPPLVGQQDYPLLTDDFDLAWTHRGRFGRLSYMAWVTVLALAITVVITLLASIGALAGVTFNSEAGLIFILAGTLCLIPFLYFMVVFQIRRLHDLNLSGWWIAIPLVNTLFSQVLIAISHSVNLGLVLTGISLIINIVFTLYLMIAEGYESLNDYGFPRETLPWEKITGWIYVVLTVIGLAGFAWTAIPAYQNYQKQAAMMQASIQPSYQFPQTADIQ